MRSKKGRWFREASSHKTLYTPSPNPLCSQPQRTPPSLAPPPHSLQTPGLGPPPLPNVCATHWFRPFLLLSGSTGPRPAALDQTVPCRVRKSAFSTTAKSRLTCLPLKPWGPPASLTYGSYSLAATPGTADYCDEAFWLPRVEEAQRCCDGLKTQGLGNMEGLQAWQGQGRSPQGTDSLKKGQKRKRQFPRNLVETHAPVHITP